MKEFLFNFEEVGFSSFRGINYELRGFVIFVLGVFGLVFFYWKGVGLFIMEKVYDISLRN